MIVTLDEVKRYLRVDYPDDDALLETMINSAEQLCANVMRRPANDVPGNEEENVIMAVLYTVAYLYEHREEADYKALTLSLRALLFGLRKEGF